MRLAAGRGNEAAEQERGELVVNCPALLLAAVFALAMVGLAGYVLVLCTRNDVDDIRVVLQSIIWHGGIREMLDDVHMGQPYVCTDSHCDIHRLASRISELEAHLKRERFNIPQQRFPAARWEEEEHSKGAEAGQSHPSPSPPSPSQENEHPAHVTLPQFDPWYPPAVPVTIQDKQQGQGENKEL